MPTHLDIDPNLLEEAKQIGGQKTKTATVNEALAEYIRRRKQLQVKELFHTIDFDPKPRRKR